MNKIAARLKYLFATEVASIPPQKVRQILLQQGWQFTPIQADPLMLSSASPHGGRYLPCVTIHSPAGVDVYAAGQDSLVRIYQNDLKRAARTAYLTSPA